MVDLSSKAGRKSIQQSGPEELDAPPPQTAETPLETTQRLILSDLYDPAGQERDSGYSEIIDWEFAQAQERGKADCHWTNGSPWPGHYAALKSQQEPGADFLQTQLNGELVVDCGGGFGSGMIRFLEEVNAAGYLNVDRAFAPDDAPDHTKDLSAIAFPHYDGPLAVAAVSDDILRVLSYLPDNSCSIAMNSVGMGMVFSSQWEKAVAQELERVVPPGKLILSTNSGAVDYVSPGVFEQVTPELWGADEYTEEFDKMRLFQKRGAR